MKVKNIKVTKVEFKPELVTKNPEQLKAIKALLPKHNHEKISFDIDASTAVANAIRREVMSGVKWKCLYVPLENIETNEPFLKLHEFCKRIAFIPIDQDIDMNETFSINVKNTDMKSNRVIIHSDALTGKSQPFDSTFRIAELHPGNYLKVSGIKVIEGYSYRNDSPDGANAKFSPTANVAFEVLDYTYVMILDDNQQYSSAYVKTSDLKLKLTGLPSSHKIVIMEKASYANNLEGLALIKYKHFTNKLIGKYKTYQSTEVHPQSYHMCVRTLGNIEPKLLMRRTIEVILDKLNRLDKALVKHMSGDETADIDIIEDGCTQMKVYEEKQTLANLLVSYIFKLDPNIKFINWDEPHVQENSFVLKIIHPEPIKITRDSIAKIIIDFNKIKAAFK
jgi:DNA-directed RNA polymerase subunit L